MNQCITTYKNYEVSYKWIIKSFRDYMNSVTNTQDAKISSLSFPINGLDKERFSLMLDGKTLTLVWKNLAKPELLHYKLYILDVKDEKRFMVSGSTRNTVDNNSVRISEFIKIDDIGKSEAELLPDDDLSIGCEIIIYGKVINTAIAVYRCQIHESIGDHFHKLLDDSSSSDFIIIIDKTEFKVHKLVLSTRSPVFAAMLTYEMNEKQTNQCTIIDIHPEIFDLVIQFIYTDKLADNKLNVKDAMALLVAADKYEINKLKEICVGLLCRTIKAENVVAYYLLAKKCHVKNFIKYTDDFIKANRDRVFSFINFDHMADSMGIRSILNFPGIE